MSKIVEDGAKIKQKIDYALDDIKSLKIKKAKAVKLNNSFTNDRDVSFDDETVLLVSLDKDNAENPIENDKRMFDNNIAASEIVSN